MGFLFDEHPIVIDRKIAKLIGLNEAIVLQQIKYWVNNARDGKRNFIEGRHWVYNTLEQWTEQFPFFSKQTIMRALDSLADKHLIFIGNHNKTKFDRTRWYTLNDEFIKFLDEEMAKNPETAHLINLENAFSKMENGDSKTENAFSILENRYYQNDNIEGIKLVTPIPEITTETSSRKKVSKKESEKKPPQGRAGAGTHTHARVLIEESQESRPTYNEIINEFTDYGVPLPEDASMDERTRFVGNKRLNAALKSWIQMRCQMPGRLLTNQGFETALKQLNDVCRGEPFRMAEAVDIATANSWTDLQHAGYIAANTP